MSLVFSNMLVIGNAASYAAHPNGRRRGHMQRLLQVVLSAWREAERVAAERSEGSQEHKAALVASDRLRLLYGELLESAKADDDRAVVDAVPPLSTLETASD
jgi:hypothetical protein